MIILKCAGIAALILCIPYISCSQNFKNEFGFRSDNDSYLGYGQDRYYTNGIFLNFRHATKKESLKANLEKKVWEVEAGQYMYNPQSGRVKNIREVDRPFAAYLYAGVKLNWFKKDEQLFQLSVNTGTIGPRALGKEAQEFIHNTIGFYTISGWQYQVNNEIGINSSLKYLKLLGRSHTGNDLGLDTYLNLGNTFSGAGAGIIFRTGSLNKYFESVTCNSRISNATRDSVPKKEVLFFTRPMINFVAYDASVQGGLFSDNKGPVIYKPNYFQYSHEFGIAYAQNRWTLNFSVIFKSKDTKVQLHPHQYGSIFIYYRF